MVEMIQVGCKLPNGLKMRLHDMVDYDEPVMGGGFKTAKRAVLRQNAPIITIKGTAFKLDSTEPRPLIVAGAAITSVPKDFWVEWHSQNRMHPAVVNKMVFAAGKTEDVQARARDLESIKSGQDPILPVNDPRVPKSRALAIEPGTMTET